MVHLVMEESGVKRLEISPHVNFQKLVRDKLHGLWTRGRSLEASKK